MSSVSHHFLHLLTITRLAYLNVQLEICISLFEMVSSNFSEDVNVVEPANPRPAQAQIRDDAKAQRAREAGWNEPTAFNYEASTAATREEREAATRAVLDRDAHSTDIPLWASAGVKYEWKDEYGEVGPQVPELERVLYKDQFQSRIGGQFAA